MFNTHIGQVYTMGTDIIDGNCKTFARLDCGSASCDYSEKINMRPDMPTHIVLRKFEQHGWSVHERLKRRCICPKCRRIEKERKDMKPQPSLAVAITADAPPPRNLTPLETVSVIDKLRAVFDEKAGIYLDGMSDKKIGEQLDIPWASVAQFRESIGYKLKGNPELLALKGDIAVMREMLAECERRLTKLEGEMK